MTLYYFPCLTLFKHDDFETYNWEYVCAGKPLKPFLTCRIAMKYFRSLK